MINTSLFTLIGTSGGGTSTLSSGASGGTVAPTSSTAVAGTSIIDLGPDRRSSLITAFLNITATTGTTPAVTVTLQDSPDKVTWFNFITFSNVTGSTSTQSSQSTRQPARYLRPSTAITGTSTPTVTLNVQAVASDPLAVSVNTTLGGTASFLPLTFGPSANGGSCQIVINSENLTLATGATTTSTTGNLLPANALILAVNTIITTTITTAANWSVGDVNVTARFSTSNSTLTAGTSQVGVAQWSGAVTTLNAGPSQAAAAKVVITTNANPGGGSVRIEVVAAVFTAPTS